MTLILVHPFFHINHSFPSPQEIRKYVQAIERASRDASRIFLYESQEDITPSVQFFSRLGLEKKVVLIQTKHAESKLVRSSDEKLYLAEMLTNPVYGGGYLIADFGKLSGCLGGTITRHQKYTSGHFHLVRRGTF